MANIIKRNKHRILFIATISLIFCFSLFANKIAVGHDNSFHINRLYGIVSAFQDGQFLPKLYPYTNNGYGYAIPLFYCDIFLYPFAFLFWLGVPLVKCYRLMIIFYAVLTIISIFYCSSKIFESSHLAPYITTILYTFCNYHLYDFYLRHALGENMAFVFIPFVLLSCYYVLVQHKNKWILLGLSFSFLCFSHLISFIFYCFVFLIFIIVFIIYNRKNKELLKRILLTILKAVILGTLLSAFYIFPLFEQLKSQEFNVTLYNGTFDITDTPSLLDLLLTPFTFLYKSQDINKLYIFGLGYSFYIFDFLYVYILAKKKNNVYMTTLFIVGNIAFLFSAGIIPFSKYLSFLNFFQFASRFNIIAFPLLSFTITYSLIKINIKYEVPFIILIFVYSCVNAFIIQKDQLTLGNHYYDNQTHNEIFDFSEKLDSWYYNVREMSMGDYLPTTYVVNYLLDSQTIKIINNEDSSYYDACGVNNLPIEYTRRGSKIEFNWESKEYPDTIMVPLTYYKGYSIYAIDDNGNKQSLKYKMVYQYKQVAFETLVGKYTYSVHYDGTKIQNISLLISTLSFLSLSVFYILKRRDAHALYK